MSAPEALAWHEGNRRVLEAALDRLGPLLQADRGVAQAAQETYAAPVAAIESAMPMPSALTLLVEKFGLTPFERDVLLLAGAGDLRPELASKIAGLPQAAGGRPTFLLALDRLPEADRQAITPDAVLRRGCLVQLGSGPALGLRPLGIRESVLHYLTGYRQLDAQLRPVLRRTVPLMSFDGGQVETVEAVGRALAAAVPEAVAPVIHVAGSDDYAAEALAVETAGALGLTLYALRADAIPPEPAEAHALAALWNRDAVLLEAALFIHVAGCDDALVRDRAWRFADRLGGVLIVADAEAPGPCRRAVHRAEVTTPGRGEQRRLWQVALGESAAELDEQIERVVSHFALSSGAIARCAAQARGLLGGGTGQGDPLWDICRRESRAPFDGLARRIEPKAGWDDLVLPAPQKTALREIAIHLRHRATVYHDWQFSEKSGRGLGISAMFAGPSGTGKTMAAEVLAGDLDLDLYCIDLSALVSKYIGETEKNLARVFDAAEASGAILLFDECDALFGKRSEVKDSHDRYANVEVSYLLQRMEAFRGLAILTTNMKHAVDEAFLRRLRFIVQFPFPDAARRREIWQRVFPAAAPLGELDSKKLARLSLAGGNIRNIAMNAAFLAAEAGTPIGMDQLRQATHSEYRKLEKPLSESETRGWA